MSEKTYEQGIKDGWRAAITAAWKFIDAKYSEPRAGRPHPIADDILRHLEANAPQS